MRGLLLLAMLAGCAVSLRASVVAEYVAGAAPKDPAASGWKEIKSEDGAIAAGADGAWRIGNESSHVNRLAYRWLLPINSFDGKGWRAETTLRVAAASVEKAQDAYLEVQDGISEWTIVFAKDMKAEGIGFLDKENQWQSLYDGDVSSKPVTVEVTYVPASDSLKVKVNGAAVEREITREDVRSTRVPGRYFITWGDGASAAHPGKSPSEVFWQSVKFETKP